jgi:hypothetical protein
LRTKGLQTKSPTRITPKREWQTGAGSVHRSTYYTTSRRTLCRLRVASYVAALLAALDSSPDERVRLGPSEFCCHWMGCAVGVRSRVSMAAITRCRKTRRRRSLRSRQLHCQSWSMERAKQFPRRRCCPRTTCTCPSRGTLRGRDNCAGAGLNPYYICAGTTLRGNHRNDTEYLYSFVRSARSAPVERSHKARLRAGKPRAGRQHEAGGMHHAAWKVCNRHRATCYRQLNMPLETASSRGSASSHSRSSTRRCATPHRSVCLRVRSCVLGRRFAVALYRQSRQPPLARARESSTCAVCRDRDLLRELHRR